MNYKLRDIMNQGDPLEEVIEMVDSTFMTAFGRTPLRQRLEDIHNESVELKNATDLANMKEELGDLLASALMMCSECQWDAAKLVGASLDKIRLRMDQYQSLGRKTKVALLGGAFDPPHIGHIRIAEFVLNTSKTFDEVWIAPCARHMYGKQMEDAEHRLKMCELATRHDGRIKVFDYEIQNELAGETYHFVKRLLEEPYAKHKYDFSIIIGQDNANTFDKWVNYEDLVKMIRFVVVSRSGTDRDPAVDWYLDPPHIYLYGGDEIPNISSTDIRLWLCEGEDLPGLCHDGLDPKVYAYIQQHRLYDVVTQNS